MTTTDPIETSSTSVAAGAETVPFCDQMAADAKERAAKKAAGDAHAVRMKAERERIDAVRQKTQRTEADLDQALDAHHHHVRRAAQYAQEAALLFEEAEAHDREGATAKAAEARSRAHSASGQSTAAHDNAARARADAKAARDRGASG